MALKHIVFLRLKVFINEFKSVEIDWGMKLGEPPIGFDDSFLKTEFQPRLNENPIGFTDILIKPIAKSQVNESTEVGDLVDAILAKSSVKTRDLYEAKMGERVRLGLRRQIAELAGIDEKDVVPTKRISDYLSDPSVSALLDGLNKEFKKYLIGGAIQRSDLQGTLNAVKDDIVLRMLA